MFKCDIPKYITLNEYGSVLAGNLTAMSIRYAIQDCKGSVILDFKGVRTVSLTFADELLGVLAEKLGSEEFFKKIKLINISDTNRKVCLYVVGERLT